MSRRDFDARPATIGDRQRGDDWADVHNPNTRSCCPQGLTGMALRWVMAPQLRNSRSIGG